MEALIHLQKKAQRLTPEKVRSDFFNFIRGLETYIAEFNKEQLNKDSKDIFENPLGFYSKATEYISFNNALLGKGNKIKKEGDPYDLEDTGDFLKSISASVESFSLVFKATDPKTDKVLKNLLSNEILGLSDKDLNKVINEKFIPYMGEYYLKNIFSGIN